MYRYHVCSETNLPDPGFTPYYNVAFFQVIREVKERTSVNPITMTVKDWYKYILENSVTMSEVDEDGLQGGGQAARY